MHLDSRLLVSWLRDVLLAYAGGLVLGAPLALLAAWLTGRDGAATACLLLAMAVLLAGLRRRDARHAPARAAVAPLPRRQAA